MYFHSLYYSLKVLIRDRAMVFWCLAFPIILGTMFLLCLRRTLRGGKLFRYPRGRRTGGNKKRCLPRRMAESPWTTGENQLLETLR